MLVRRANQQCLFPAFVLVIPAKEGIQISLWQGWIPAFAGIAGMTKGS